MPINYKTGKIRLPRRAYGGGIGIAARRAYLEDYLGLTPEQIVEWKRARGLEQRREDRRTRGIPAVEEERDRRSRGAKRPRWAKMAGIRKWIADRMRQLDRMEFRLERHERSFATRPWLKAGCLTLAAWTVQHPFDANTYRSWVWRSRVAKRKARISHLEGSFSFWQWLDRLHEYGDACAYCRRERAECIAEGHDLEADHLFPISRPNLAPFVSNRIGNIVPACKSCNSSKGDNDPRLWLAGFGPSAHPNVWLQIEAVAGSSRVLLRAVSA